VSPFPVAFTYLRVLVVCTHVSNNNFHSHLPNLTAQVVAQFPRSRLPLNIFGYLCLDQN
ncbi:unnamed protein product, partial [Prunus brigantina]